MELTLKQLTIINFKGIKHQVIPFKHITNIFGENESGKTSTFDSFLWLFFGKNSEYKSQFEVKRLDKDNKFIKDLETEVSAILLIDQQEIVVKKVLRQNWVRKRGGLEAEYKGDENVYFWNDVPCKESDFLVKIKGIIDEQIFKLITNPWHFNSLKWEERRNMIVDLAGNVTNEEVFDSIVTAANKNQFTTLINALNQGKTIEEFKKQLSLRKSKIKDEADQIPGRIDEVRRLMPKELNFSALRADLDKHNESLLEVNGLLNNEMEQQKEENKLRTAALKEYNLALTKKQQTSFDIKSKMQNIEFEVKQLAREESGQIDSKLVSKTRELTDKEIEQKRYADGIVSLESEIAKKQTRLESLRSAYDSIDAEKLEFDDNAFVCPSCKQPLPEDGIESKKAELTKNFNNNKLGRLEDITKEGVALKEEVEKLNQRIAEGKELVNKMNTDIDTLKAEIEELKQQSIVASGNVETRIAALLNDHKEYQQLNTDLVNNEAIVITEPAFQDLKSNEELSRKASTLNTLIKELETKLADEQQIEKGNTRIEELEKQESILAQELADVEGAEFAILQFSKGKMDAIENRINGKFKYVKFKMFSLQNNGGEKECCDTLINGVPYSDANTAGKVNAGIDIINAFCKHYNVFAPIFIDNRESVTNLIDSESQIVNLIVSAGDKTLRIA